MPSPNNPSVRPIGALLSLATAAGGVAALLHRPPSVHAATGDTAAVVEPSPAAVQVHKPPVVRRRPPAARASRSAGWRRVLNVTAYCATGNRTASGVWPAVGQAATYDRRIRFGTQLDVAGRRVVVTDRIGSGSDVDLFFGSDARCESAALTFGRRHLVVAEVPR